MLEIILWILLGGVIGLWWPQTGMARAVVHGGWCFFWWLLPRGPIVWIVIGLVELNFKFRRKGENG
jgi:hypothetical protein